MSVSVRLAVRAVILIDGKLLLVNAYPGAQSDLWCAPGGGVERGSGLPENLIREVHEETGLTVAVGVPCLVNEFHDPTRRFHQVDIYFHATVQQGRLADDWTDPMGVVNRWQLVTRAQMAGLRVKPDTLADVAFGTGGLIYDPLELIVR